MHFSYSPDTFPILPAYRSNTVPILFSYSSHTLSILFSYGNHTEMIRKPYGGHTEMTCFLQFHVRIIKPGIRCLFVFFVPLCETKKQGFMQRKSEKIQQIIPVIGNIFSGIIILYGIITNFFKNSHITKKNYLVSRPYHFRLSECNAPDPRLHLFYEFA